MTERAARRSSRWRRVELEESGARRSGWCRASTLYIMSWSLEMSETERWGEGEYLWERVLARGPLLKWPVLRTKS